MFIFFLSLKLFYFSHKDFANIVFFAIIVVINIKKIIL